MNRHTLHSPAMRRPAPSFAWICSHQNRHGSAIRKDWRLMVSINILYVNIALIDVRLLSEGHSCEDEQICLSVVDYKCCVEKSHITSLWTLEILFSFHAIHVLVLLSLLWICLLNLYMSVWLFVYLNVRLLVSMCAFVSLWKSSFHSSIYPLPCLFKKSK